MKLSELVAGVRLLSLDAGNTVIFLDHARLAAAVSRHGVTVTAEDVVRGEGAAKRRLVERTMVDVDWPSRSAPGARGWGQMVATTAVEAGLPKARAAELLADAWREHCAKNFWCKVPDGFGKGRCGPRRGSAARPLPVPVASAVRVAARRAQETPA